MWSEFVAGTFQAHYLGVGVTWPSLLHGICLPALPWYFPGVEDRGRYKGGSWRTAGGQEKAWYQAIFIDIL